MFDHNFFINKMMQVYLLNSLIFGCYSLELLGGMVGVYLAPCCLRVKWTGTGTYIGLLEHTGSYRNLRELIWTISDLERLKGSQRNKYKF